MTVEEMLIRAEMAMEWRKAIARAVAGEREACARVVEEAAGSALVDPVSVGMFSQIAAAIRARKP